MKYIYVYTRNEVFLKINNIIAEGVVSKVAVEYGLNL